MGLMAASDWGPHMMARVLRALVALGQQTYNDHTLEKNPLSFLASVKRTLVWRGD